MSRKHRFLHIILLILCVLFIGVMGSCGTSRGNVKAKSTYSKKRTKQAKWNSTTSQTTTYHIRKHNTRRHHNH